MKEYKGYELMPWRDGYLVLYAGDEIYFGTETEAMNFIDEVQEVE